MIPFTLIAESPEAFSRTDEVCGHRSENIAAGCELKGKLSLLRAGRGLHHCYLWVVSVIALKHRSATGLGLNGYDSRTAGKHSVNAVSDVGTNIKGHVSWLYKRTVEALLFLRTIPRRQGFVMSLHHPAWSPPFYKALHRVLARCSICPLAASN
jgi:hypothetical protein